jgi:uncharacterized protein YvpB
MWKYILKNKFVSDVYVLLRSNVLSLSQQCMVISFSFVLSLYSKNIAEVIYKDHTWNTKSQTNKNYSYDPDSVTVPQNYLVLKVCLSKTAQDKTRTSLNTF